MTMEERWRGRSQEQKKIQEKKTVCLLCYEGVAVVKGYNLHWPFDSKHKAKYAKVNLILPWLHLELHLQVLQLHLTL